MSNWTYELRARLAKLRLAPAREAEIIDELSQHLDDRHAELRSQGLAEPDALRLALDEIDDHDLLAREMRVLRQSFAPEPSAIGAPPRRLLADVWKDTVYAARMLRKHRGLTIAALLTLALGIGANTAIFSLINATLLQRLPVKNRTRLVSIASGYGVFSYLSYSAIRDGNHMFDAVAAWSSITASLNADDETDLVSGVIVTGNFFEVLGVAAEYGRVLGPQDDVTPGAHPVAVISDRLWHTRFGGRPDMLNRPIRLNGQMFTVVGVTPPEFPGPQLGAIRDVYVPMMMQALMRPPRAGYSGDMNPDLLRNPNNGWLSGIGLLKPGVAPAQAEAELVALAATFARSVNRTPPRQMTLVPLDEGDPKERRQMRSVAALLGAVVGAVLLIACANVANLLLSKAASRRHEIAVRLAIGASRWRIVRQLLTESLLLALLGGSAGVGVAWIMVAAFRASAPPAAALPMAGQFSIDPRVLLFTGLLSLVTGLVFGVVPALQASRPQLVSTLKDESFVQDERRRRFNMKHGLVVAEIALSLLLLVAAGLFLRSLRAVEAIDPGIATEKLLAAPLNIHLLRYTKVQGRAFYQTAVERMRAIPGVESASLARMAVLSGNARLMSLSIEGRDQPDNPSRSEGSGLTADEHSINVNVVGPAFFETLGIPLLEGRDFRRPDVEESVRVCVINQTAARLHFPNQAPIGKRVSFTGVRGPWVEIVGLARDSKYSMLGEPDPPVAYLPLSQNHETGVILYLRASVPPVTLVTQVRRELQAIEPNLPVPDIRTMSDTIGASLYAARMGTMLLTLFGGLAVLLASVGVYGVLAFSISRRTRELGIRMALGAEARNLFGLVLREGMTLVLIGVAIGLAGALAGARSIAAFLYGINPHDALTFAAGPAVLILIALVACVLPARRAMKIDPIRMLRNS